MAAFKKLFKLESKIDYTDKIPDTLKPEQFHIHQTFQHGFPFQPSCLAYDVVQSVLAIGSHTGTVSLIAKSGLECHFSHSSGVGVLQLLFIHNKGHLISRCNNNSLYLWSVCNKAPEILHKLDFQRDNMSHMHYPYNSDWLYVGMEGGNVHVVNITDLTLSGYTIYWDKFVESGVPKVRPGDVLSIEENPVDNTKILVSFTDGLCVVWNTKLNMVEKRFHYQANDLAVLMSVCWHGSGKLFACSYSDGNIAIFNIKNEAKPDKVITPHGSQSNNSPIVQLQWFYTEPDSWLIFSGGYKDKNHISNNTITLQTTQHIHLKSFEESIVQFLCLPSSPFATDFQHTFALAVLTQSRLIMFDLQTPGMPNFFIPFSFDVHISPVTSIEYCGNCPDDFIAQLHSVKSKLPHQQTSPKPWPLKGGKWGQESPDPWTDLIITGHQDGTVRLWFCRSVIMQPLFTISTTCYFRIKSLPATPTLTASTSSNSPRATPTLPTIEEAPPKEETDEPPSTISNLASPPSDTATTPDLLTVHADRKSVNSKRSKSVFKRVKKSFKKISKKPTSSNLDNDITSAAADSPTEDVDEDDDVYHEHENEPQTSKGKPTSLKLPTQSDSSPLSSPVFVRQSSTDSTNDYVILSLNNRNHDNKLDDDMAIHKLSFSTYSQTLCIANVRGHCLAFEFSLKPTNKKSQSLHVDLANDSVIINDTAEKELKQQISVQFDNELEQQLPGFHVIQHCLCYYDKCNVDITALKYCSLNGLLVIGTDYGLVIVNTFLNQTMKVLGTLTSILYLADPSTYSKLVKKLTQQTLQLQKGLTIPELPRNLSKRRLSAPLIVPSIELPHIRDTNAKSKARHFSEINDQDTPAEHLVTCIELVQMFIHKTQPPAMTLWVGTYSGRIAVYGIKTMNLSQGKSSTELLPTEIILDKKSPIVNFHFLSEWGEQLITPYKPHLQDAADSPDKIISVSRRLKTAAELPNNEKSANYVVIVTKESIHCVGFPGNHVINHVDPVDNYHIVHSGVFTCNGLPCLMSLYSNALVQIHTLPGLKPMLQHQCEFLADTRCLYTFRISGDGQAIYQLSPSQFQRVSITKHDNLNIPSCFPELYMSICDPTPQSKGVLNDLLSGLTTPTVVNRDKIFGLEAAGRAWTSIAKIDKTYEKEDKTAKVAPKKVGGGANEGGGKANEGGGGTNNVYAQTRQKLDERNKHLKDTEEIAKRMSKDATDFASVAAQLAAKYGKK